MVVEPEDDAVGMSRTSDDIESTEETLAILRDPVAMEQIREIEEGSPDGERVTVERTCRVDLRRRVSSTGGPGLEPG